MTPGESTLALSWTGANGGVGVTGYEVCRWDVGSTCAAWSSVGLVTSSTFEGLTPATTYVVGVRAVYANATYAWEAERTTVADTTAPTVTLTTPTAGATVTDGLLVVAAARDAGGIATVTFTVTASDGTQVWTSTTSTAPYNAHWDLILPDGTTTATPGTYTVTAKGKDPADNTTTVTTPITVVAALTTVEVLPAVASLAVTGTQAYTARGIYADGTIENPLGPTGSLWATALASGAEHTCVLRPAGGVMCWGYNATGQTDVPVALETSGAIAVAPGEDHTCVLTTSGGVTCWGENGYGQTNVPPELATSGASAVAAGPFHTCAVTTAGGGTCWGEDSFGKTTVPPELATSGASAVAVGEEHTCALTTAGGVTCWGWNRDGQTNVPAELATSGVAALTVYGNHSCALTTTGGVTCWGANWSGQTTVPDELTTNGAMAVAAGQSHTCAVTTAGGVTCWGSNRYGQTTVPALNEPVRAVSAGYSSACALEADGAVTCWGENWYGPEPVPVPTVSWSSTTPSVATVTPTGVATGEAVGTTGIQATWQGLTGTGNLTVGYTLALTLGGGGSGTVTSDPGGITCGTDCAETYPATTSVGLTASPASGSVFTGWSGVTCSEGSQTTSTCTVTMTQAQTVTATFEPLVVLLTVAVSGDGDGTVTGGGLVCFSGTTCSAAYTTGTSVALTAWADSGSIFTGWSGGTCAEGNQMTWTCTVTMTQAQTVTATFEPLVFLLRLAVRGDGDGTVTGGGVVCFSGTTCWVESPTGTSVALTASPDSGSIFTGWSGAVCAEGTQSSLTCTVTMTQAQVLTATFRRP